MARPRAPKRRLDHLRSFRRWQRDGTLEKILADRRSVAGTAWATSACARGAGVHASRRASAESPSRCPGHAVSRRRRDDEYVVVPAYATGAERDGPSGYTYAAIVLRPQGGLLAALRDIRFSGWLAPPEDGWQIVVPASGAGTVAAGRQGVFGVAGWLATRMIGPVLALRVVLDRQLALVVWADGEETGRYASDPSKEPAADDDLLDEPVGAEAAYAIAAACDRPDAADDLLDLLSEQLDPDSMIESERLGHLLRLLGLPTWLVAAAHLPRRIPTGPSRTDLTRLGVGLPGLRGQLAHRLVDVVRRHRPPPPVLSDPPRKTSSGVDPWLL